MRLEAETTLTRPLLRRYLFWLVFRKRKGYGNKLLAALGVLALLVGATLLVDPAETTGCVVLGFLAALAAVFLLLPRISASLQLRSARQDALRQRLVFGDDAFEVSSEGEGAARSRTTVRYAGMPLAVENGGDLYLFFDRRQAYLMRKTDFVQGTSDELVARLRQVLGARFVKGR
jgi:hypothetical protein